MNIRFIHSFLVALFGLFLVIGQVHAAQFFFSTSSTLTSVTAPLAATQNPTFTIDTDFSSVGHLYLFVKLAPDIDFGDSSENINSMGLDVVQEGANGDVAEAHGTTYSLYGQTGSPAANRRWDVPSPNTVPTPMSIGGESVGRPTLAVFRRAAVSTVGLQGPAVVGDHDLANSPDDASGNHYLRVADITIQADVGFTDTSKNPLGIPIFLRTNTQTVNYDGTLPNHGPNTFFGAGDAAVNGTIGSGGVQSANPDAFIMFVSAIPEPAGAGLLAIAPLALVRRRDG